VSQCPQMVVAGANNAVDVSIASESRVDRYSQGHDRFFALNTSTRDINNKWSLEFCQLNRCADCHNFWLCRIFEQPISNVLVVQSLYGIGSGTCVCIRPMYSWVYIDVISIRTVQWPVTVHQALYWWRVQRKQCRTKYRTLRNPHVQGIRLDMDPSTTTLWVLLFRNESIHDNAQAPTPKSVSSRRRRIWWSMQSNAAERSRLMRSAADPRSFSACRSSKTCRR